MAKFLLIRRNELKAVLARREDFSTKPVRDFIDTDIPKEIKEIEELLDMSKGESFLYDLYEDLKFVYNLVGCPKDDLSVGDKLTLDEIGKRFLQKKGV
jgi:hypothetical protein